MSKAQNRGFMFDGPTPNRNDDCWCGSGKKYKKCHLEIDERLQELHNEGRDVPSRSLLKTPEDIEGIKHSAKVNIGALDYVAEHIKAGVSTEDIDRWVHEYTVEHGAIPAPLDYQGFPKSVCTSVNEVVCHGIPSKTEILKDGDIINVDCSTIKDGYYSDSSRMFCIGNVNPELEQLVRVTKECVDLGLQQVKPWGCLGDISQAVQDHAHKHGYSVVAEFGGHGIGLEFHEEPFVSFVIPRGSGMVLAPGCVFTIEPMINLGKAAIDMSDPNGWTVRTKDRKPTAQWEIQVAVTESGAEVLCW